MTDVLSTTSVPSGDGETIDGEPIAKTSAVTPSNVAVLALNASCIMLTSQSQAMIMMLRKHDSHVSCYSGCKARSNSRRYDVNNPRMGQRNVQDVSQ